MFVGISTRALATSHSWSNLYSPFCF